MAGSGDTRWAARYTMNNYHNTSSVNTMIDTLGWPTPAACRLKTRLIMFYKITHCLIAIPTDILVPSKEKKNIVYHTWVEVNYLQIVYFHLFFSYKMYIEIIGLQEWIENSWC
jgi:hypothetical protein